MIKYFLAFLILFHLSLFAPYIHADTEQKNNDSNKGHDEDKTGSEEAEITIKVGNLAFPVSQQPTPLISFGQNLLEEKQAQAILGASDYNGKGQYFITVYPALIYGITDDFSLTTSLPIAFYKQDSHQSSGLGDAILQVEYAFYTKAYRTYYDQATVVANITLPTGSATTFPNTGMGSSTFFVGGTFSRVEVNWLYFTSYGEVITTSTSSRCTKYGNQFLYQAGFGRRIYNNAHWLFDWLIEFDGTYYCKDRITGEINPDSGGNVIYITPSLFISSSESLVLQIGAGYPVYQHLFGHQQKNDCLLQLLLGWTF